MTAVGKSVGDQECTHLCQALTIASVESTIVPSISNRRPSKAWISGGREKEGRSDMAGVGVGSPGALEKLTDLVLTV